MISEKKERVAGSSGSSKSTRKKKKNQLLSDSANTVDAVGGRCLKEMFLLFESFKERRHKAGSVWGGICWGDVISR